MVKKAMGGILLVDEAYYLYNAANDRDYGQARLASRFTARPMSATATSPVTSVACSRQCRASAPHGPPPYTLVGSRSR